MMMMVFQVLDKSTVVVAAAVVAAAGLVIQEPTIMDNLYVGLKLFVADLYLF